MIRPIFSWLLVVFVALPLLADDTKVDQADAKKTDEKAEKSIVERIKEEPNNWQLLRTHVLKVRGIIIPLTSEKPDEAEKQLKELEDLLNELKPDDASAQRLLTSAQRLVMQLRDKLSIDRTTLEKLEKLLTESPDDTTQITLYAKKLNAVVTPFVHSDPDKAKKQLQSVKDFLTELKEKANDRTKVAIDNTLATSFRRVEQTIELAQTTLEDFEKQINESPNDTSKLALYISKLNLALRPAMDADPAEAEKQLKAAKDFLASVKEKGEEATKRQIDNSLRMLGRLEQSIENAKKLAALIGTEATQLQDHVSAWVNGEAMTDAEFKGKVVLLDFWAVWCGPCIATFPHLREWQEKYADKGLVIVGLTRKYNFKWDDETGRAARSQDPVSAEDEQLMLQKFCEQHKLHHRIAVQKDQDSALSDYYAVGGIPHVVLIDREGKIQLVKVGSGPANAKAISEKLEKLIGS